MKKKVYLLFDVPSSSNAAFWVMIFIMFCIFASTVCFCLQTVPSLEGLTAMWFWFEIFFVSVFTFEYVIRFWATPQRKMEFVKDPFNVVDLLAILPFYVDIIVTAIVGAEAAADLRFLRAIRLVRIFRLFKVGKYSTKMQLIMVAMRRSSEAMVLLGFFLLIGLVIFGASMYFLERGDWVEKMGCYVREGEDKCSPFNSIPHSFYWGVTTMTTVGYGDTLPVTDVGKCITGIAMVLGILVLALPVTMIGNQFTDAHAEVETEQLANKLLHEIDTEEELVDKLKVVAAELTDLQMAFDDLLPGMKHLAAASLVADKKKANAREALQGLEPIYDILARSITNSLADVKLYARSMLPPGPDGKWPPPTFDLSGMKAGAGTSTSSTAAVGAV